MKANPRMRILAAAAVAILVAGTAIIRASSHDSVCIEDVPHVRQKPDFCGEACVEMVLKKLGHGGDQDWVFDRSGVNPLLGRGCVTRELKKALETIGFRPGPVWHKVRAAHAVSDMERMWQGLHEDLCKGVPSIVCMHYADRPKTTEHFRLVLGYDGDRHEVIYHEPAEDNAAYRRMKRPLFIKLWPLKYRKDAWTVVRFRLEAGKLREAIPATTFTSADYAQHLRRLKAKVDLTGFHAIIEPPFTVIGDESRATVEHHARRTVKWCCDHLRKLYFTKEPGDIYDIWLFKDKASYRKHTKELFGDSPDTPFGYFSEEHGALIMNIGTGGGTLCHEIVHAFIGTNFPNCPAWFNEGLASLYEQCWSPAGRILGKTNWRLAGLQKAIRAGSVPPFRKLCSTSRYEFYHKDAGSNYAQARYLFYYLQQQRLLVKYYHAFRKGCAKDPTGYQTLQQLLGQEDLVAWQDQWAKWVLKLRFP